MSVGVCPHIDVHAHWIWTEAPNMIDKCWPGSCATSVLLLWFVTRWTPKPHEFTGKPFKKWHIIELVILRWIMWHCDDSWWDDRIECTPSWVRQVVRSTLTAWSQNRLYRTETGLGIVAGCCCFNALLSFAHLGLFLLCEAPLPWQPTLEGADVWQHPLKTESQENPTIANSKKIT